MKVSRRSLLKALAALPLAGACAVQPAGSAPVTLAARVARQRLISDAYPETEVWTYGGSVPGPQLRFRQGDTLRVVLENRLPAATTIHWHGLRVPNAMDGVPHVTQPPVAPGERFVYEFALPDAGTYWYHPHEHSQEQVARGLYGVLIVEESEPPRVDRDLVWVLSDWRLAPDASHREDFDDLFDMTHGGRIGNTVTINGRFTMKEGALEVRSGERIRLRLVNTAVARVFRLHFSPHTPRLIALDGQPVVPRRVESGVVLGPGMRADLILDFMLEPGTRTEVIDDFYPRASGRLIELRYDTAPPLRVRALDAPVALAANPLAEPDAARSVHHEILFQGGAMGTVRDALFEGERVGLAQLARQHHLAWIVNGAAVRGHAPAPLLVLKRGGHYVLDLINETAWHHPIHLHGHVFRIVARNGIPNGLREWADTVLMAPRERVQIAFVADNPGDWMLHCHVLAHQAGGMSAVLRVA
ncbi:MAG: multicopper oxidase family protein [Betaproteobacteria bacterium]